MAATTTYLNLCKSVRQEAGIHGSGPASVATTIDMEKRIVDWVREAWRQIQRKRQDWLFMRGDFSLATTAGAASYDIATVLGLSDIAPDMVTCYLTSSGVAGEFYLQHLDYDTYRRRYTVGSQTNGKPAAFTVSPARKLLIGPAPDAVYTVRGQGRKLPQVLTANTDIVALDDEYVDVIKWKAVLLYAGFEEAGNVFAHADAMYQLAMRNLEREQLPRMRNYVEPLA